MLGLGFGVLGLGFSGWPGHFNQAQRGFGILWGLSLSRDAGSGLLHLCEGS